MSWLHKHAGRSIGLAANLVTLAPIAIAIVVVSAGFLANAPTAGLWIALAVSLSGNAILAALVVKREAAARAARGRSAEAFAERKPVTNRWIKEPGKLSTISLTNADLETAYNGSVALAGERLGSDVEVRFSSLSLTSIHGPSDTEVPQVLFDSFGSTAGRAGLIIVSGTDGVARYNSVSRTDHHRWLSDDATPWRSDPSWLQLINASSLRAGPLSRVVTLYHIRGQWQITFEPMLHDEYGETTTYAFDDAANLTEVK